MRIKSCQLTDFASYEYLDFDFTNQGLCLIQGPTGSGKSTLCDALPWILFGHTAKGGSVNEVLSWGSNSPVKGKCIVETNQCIFEIVRIRGQGKNDLYYHEYQDGGVAEVRGKDLNDTQKLINNLLGIDYEIYMLGAYFHEFCQSAQFFTTNAKNRRAICEQIIDLSLAIKIKERTGAVKSRIKNKINDLQIEIHTKNVLIKHLQSYKEMNEKKLNDWEINKNKELNTLKSGIESFEATKKERIDALTIQYEKDVVKLRESIICLECGAKKKPNKDLDSPIRYALEQEKLKENRYIDQYDRVSKSTNPFRGELKDNSVEIDRMNQESNILISDLNQTMEKFNDLEVLEEVIDKFRAVVVKNTIVRIETHTNELLEKHFDGEIKVEFDVTQADKLDVIIRKDSNICSYTQLSKGQRQLLKLCFGVSIMNAVSNNNGTVFNQLFFDESLDGLSDELKVKAFGLFETLALDHEAVFVVDHCEALKSRFNNRYSVELIDGTSALCQN